MLRVTLLGPGILVRSLTPFLDNEASVYSEHPQHEETRNSDFSEDNKLYLKKCHADALTTQGMTASYISQTKHPRVGL